MDIGLIDTGFLCILPVEEFMEYDSVVVFLAVGPAYNAKFFVISH